MTEPNVIANSTGIKFIWQTGNTEIIQLFSGAYGGTSAMHLITTDANYVVPASRIFWLLHLSVAENTNSCDFDIQKDTSPDTDTGTVLYRAYNTTDNQSYEIGYLKFVAGEYVNQDTTSGGSQDYFLRAWGVECDA